MGRLDTNTVDAAFSALNSRALAAISVITNKKTLLGGFFGNNDTLDSDAGAIRTLTGKQDDGSVNSNAALPRWQQFGYEAVDDDSKVDGWLANGKTFESSIAAIDGYSDSATLASVVHLTVDQTALDVKTKVNDAGKTLAKFAWDALPWYVWLGGAVAVGGFIYLKVK